MSCRCIMSHLLLSSCRMVDYRNPKLDQKVPEKSVPAMLYQRYIHNTTFRYHNRLAHWLILFMVLARLSTRWRCSSIDGAHCTCPFLSVLTQCQFTYSSLCLFNSDSVVCVLQMWWTWIWSQLSGCYTTFSPTTKTQSNTWRDLRKLASCLTDAMHTHPLCFFCM